MTSRSKNSVLKVAVIITAAGSSTRMGGKIKKEYLPLGEGTVLSTCIKAFIEASKNQEQPFEISNLIVTIPKNGVSIAEKAVAPFVVEFVEGGESRQRSVMNALEQIKKSSNSPEYVLIHDGARPFVSQVLISDVLFNSQKYEAAVPGITPTDTIKGIDENGFIITHLVRKNLTAVQTPQGFVFEKLYEAHKKAAQDKQDYTDDSEIWGKYCGPVKLVAGEVKNIKITYPGDLEKCIERNSL